jgi:hypothetical protein
MSAAVRRALLLFAIAGLVLVYVAIAAEFMMPANYEAAATVVVEPQALAEPGSKPPPGCIELRRFTAGAARDFSDANYIIPEDTFDSGTAYRCPK